MSAAELAALAPTFAAALRAALAWLRAPGVVLVVGSAEELRAVARLLAREGEGR